MGCAWSTELSHRARGLATAGNGAMAGLPIAKGVGEMMMDGEPKMVIVMRRDLGMRRGKEIAQGAHAMRLSVTLRRHVFGTTTRRSLGSEIGDDGPLRANLYVNYDANDFDLGDITNIRGSFKTLAGAARWADKQLAA